MLWQGTSFFSKKLFCTGFGSFSPNQNARKKSRTPICAFVTIDQSWALFTPTSKGTRRSPDVRLCCGKAHRFCRKNCFALDSEVSPRTKTPIRNVELQFVPYDRSKLGLVHTHKRGARVEVGSGHHCCCRS